MFWVYLIEWGSVEYEFSKLWRTFASQSRAKSEGKAVERWGRGQCCLVFTILGSLGWRRDIGAGGGYGGFK